MRVRKRNIYRRAFIFTLFWLMLQTKFKIETWHIKADERYRATQAFKPGGAYQDQPSGYE